MKILIVRNFPSYMDVEKNTYNIQELGLAKALTKRGHTCSLLFWTDKNEEDKTVKTEGGEITVFYRRGITFLKNTIFTCLKNMVDEYDVIQPCEYNQIQSWMCAGKYPDKTVIYHGPYYSSFNKGYNTLCLPFDLFLLKRYIKLGTKFVVKSNKAKDFLSNKGISEKKITVAGVGLDSESLGTDNIADFDLINKVKSDTSEIKLLYIGRIEERRNTLFLLDFLYETIKTKKTTLYMIGSGDESYVSKVRDKIQNLDLDENVIWINKIEQKYMKKIYTCFDYFILPTRYEIFGMVLLEAMYFGNVVFTTDNGGSEMLIQSGTNGFVLNSWDPKEWCDTLISIDSDLERKNSISISAKETIQSKYLWDFLAGVFENCYKSI